MILLDYSNIIWKTETKSFHMVVKMNEMRKSGSKVWFMKILQISPKSQHFICALDHNTSINFIFNTNRFESRIH